ncbi:peptidylprolyl isomerase [Parahaliea maris]|nr:peptidylprolyl isomerase [Parahaliea maris]
MRTCIIVFGLLVSLSLGSTAQELADDKVVVSDGSTTVSEDELRYIIEHWTPDLRQAATDGGDRIELLNQVLAIKKIASEAEKISPEEDREDYWKLEMALRQVKQRFMVGRYIENLEVPDMSDLAKERYETEKTKYASVPEQRQSSHILVLCDPRTCDGDEEQARLEAVRQKLVAGENFADLAREFSEDPGSKDSGGKFDRWLHKGTTDVDGAYLKTVFLLEAVGDYSEVVRSRFGFHIIKLDEIKPAYERPFEEVKANIIAELTNEYKKLQVKAFDDNYRFTEEYFIDNDAVDALLAPYLSEEK